MDDVDIEKIALKNALEHDGKAAEGAILPKAIGQDKSALKDIPGLKKRIATIVSAVNSMPADEQKTRGVELGIELTSQKETKAPELKPLPNVKGEVVLRLPPEPSGFMHLGHAISGLINYLYKEKYGGKLWLRFEDTNPNLVKEEFMKEFEDGYRWLEIKWDKQKLITSDMEKIYEYGERLIKDGKAYVCDCAPETIKKNRLEGLACKCRENSIQKNIELWESAKKGGIEAGKAVVRFKGDLKSKDFSLRDPNIFRVIFTTYRPYKLWPLYDFANVIEDELCGVTHILRTTEFKSRLQEELRKTLNFKQPTLIQYSRFNFEGTPFSKRKIRAMIKDGLIESWKDLRLPTVYAIKRRGIEPEAIRDFVIGVGYSESKHEYSWDLLFTLNRRIIDPVSKRLFFVADPVDLEVENAEAVVAGLKYHPSLDLGERKIKTNGSFFIDRSDVEKLKVGEAVRLKDLYSIKIEKISKAGVKAVLESRIIHTPPHDERIIHWVPRDAIKVSVTRVEKLLNADKSFNRDSLKVINGLCEDNIRSIAEGETVQFERFGFCRLDDKKGNSLIFISK